MFMNSTEYILGHDFMFFNYLIARKDQVEIIINIFFVAFCFSLFLKTDLEILKAKIRKMK